MRILHITGTLSEGGLETFLITLLPSLKQQIPGSTMDVLVLDKNKDSMAMSLRGLAFMSFMGNMRLFAIR